MEGEKKRKMRNYIITWAFAMLMAGIVINSMNGSTTPDKKDNGTISARDVTDNDGENNLIQGVKIDDTEVYISVSEDGIDEESMSAVDIRDVYANWFMVGNTDIHRGENEGIRGIRDSHKLLKWYWVSEGITIVFESLWPCEVGALTQDQEDAMIAQTNIEKIKLQETEPDDVITHKKYKLGDYMVATKCVPAKFYDNINNKSLENVQVMVVWYTPNISNEVIRSITATEKSLYRDE